ncbi:lysM domain-containing protein [Colletotrichum tofieldiae]|nr:LysM domain-containing protein [Colletotrichum tofieldiae]GKT80493.1 lysM domain-containing protein [Colletotrichum tofieldiae]GKT94855.1 lysM domain-containing protein [Colletotrichum tofieldiae]
MPATTTTITDNRVQTPQPTEPSIAGNHDKLHFAHSNGSMQLVGLNIACSKFWADVNACVGHLDSAPPQPLLNHEAGQRHPDAPANPRKDFAQLLSIRIGQ